MLKVKFVLDKNVMSASLIQSGQLPVALKNYLWEIYKKEYTLIHNNLFAFKQKDFNKNILEDVKKSTYFFEIIEKTYEKAKIIKNSFNQNELLIQNFLSKIIKENDLGLKTQTIYFVPLNRGTNLKNNKILWGLGYEGEINHNLVYITHEILHSYFIPFEKKIGDKKREISHCLIQLICEHELNFNLNKNYTHLPTHADLENLMLQVCPYFYAFLGLSKSQIEKRLKNWGVDFDISHFSKYKKEFKNFTLFQLYNWLFENQEKLNKPIVKHLITL